MEKINYLTAEEQLNMIAAGKKCHDQMDGMLCDRCGNVASHFHEDYGNVCDQCAGHWTHVLEQHIYFEDELPNISEFFDIKTHNGYITVVNPKTGNHRTFRIHTQDKEAKFAPGSRVVSLLVGPDNETSYKGFAFVVDGKVILWKRHRDDKAFQFYANMLADIKKSEQEKGLQFMLEGRCRVCNRILTNPESVESGIGPICAGK